MADNDGSCGRTKNDGVKFAMYAGFFAALASVFAKIAFSRKLVSNLLCGEGEYFRPIFYGMFTCEKIVSLMQLSSAGMILLCNAVMFRSFSKSLLLCSSAAEATITNTAANFCFSALFGWMLFSETFSSTWFTGVFFIVCGLAIIHRNQH